MKIKFPVRSLLIGLILLIPFLARAEDFFINIELFRGNAGLENFVSDSNNFVSLYPLSNFRPGPLNLSSGTNPEFRKDLAAVYQLDTLAGLYERSVFWNETMGGVPGILMFNKTALHLDIRPKFLPPDKMKLQVLISKAERRERAPEKILDVDLIATVDDPVVAGFSYDNQRYFLSIRISKTASPASAAERRDVRTTADGSRIPLPVHRVPPKTPTGPEGGMVEGEVILRVTVDKDGRVTDVQVLKPLDPEVDRATALALQQWTFEAAPAKDRSRPISFAVSFHYRKGAAWNLGSGEDPIPAAIEAAAPAAGDLERILASSAEYCRKLSAAVLDFVCEERIAEEFYNYVFDPTPTYTQITRKRRIEKFTYLYDYQMIRTAAGVREDRTLIEENGRKTKEAHAPLKTKKFFSYQSIYGPIGFFSRDRQSLFDYKLAGKSTVNGKKSWVIELKPKSDGEKLPSGKAWVDQNTSQILKLEIDAQSLEGYTQALENYDLDKVTPEFRTEHYYEVEKNGILFPSQTTFRENAIIQRGRRVQIAKTEILFTNYRFFTVQTEAAIKDRKPHP